jgi:hypothetical protein
MRLVVVDLGCEPRDAFSNTVNAQWMFDEVLQAGALPLPTVTTLGCLGPRRMQHCSWRVALAVWAEDWRAFGHGTNKKRSYRCCGGA